MSTADLAGYVAIAVGGVCVLYGVVTKEPGTIAAGAGLLGGPAIVRTGEKKEDAS
jgi:hypothetical protein